MLTTDEPLNYAGNNSPDSCYGSSCSPLTDYTDFQSDEDFIQQLSSDLDIPLLLNQGEDEMTLLNSFFDRSPDEIMSEIALPPHEDFEFPCFEVKSESSSDSSVKSVSPIHSPSEINFDLKDEMKFEPLSPLNVNIPVGMKMSPQQYRQVTKVPIKRVPIQPKTPYMIPQNKNKILLLKNSTNIVNNSTPKVVVLENVSPVSNIVRNPVSNMVRSPVSPVILSGGNGLTLNIDNIDPKALKRHQRKIKNRESACLSRKKKRDYLTSLENQVKDLAVENDTLKKENAELKRKLSKYEIVVPKGSNNMKNAVFLCMFFVSIGFHLDFIRIPLNTRDGVDTLQPGNPKALDNYNRRLLWTNDDNDKNESTFSALTMCPAAINQSESARLVLELERWIGKPDNFTEKALNISTTNARKAKARTLRRRKQKKLEAAFSTSISLGQKLPKTEFNNELQVFTPTSEHMYSEFFEAINRQDDTFYVVSFSDHHMLLPALHHNKTRRPKMSLIMPSVLPNGNASQPTWVPVMQIDCEVLDTRLLQIRYGSIPKHLINETDYHDRGSKDKDSSGTEDYNAKKAYKPYFIKQSSDEFYNVP